MTFNNKDNKNKKMTKIEINDKLMHRAGGSNRNLVYQQQDKKQDLNVKEQSTD